MTFMCLSYTVIAIMTGLLPKGILNDYLKQAMEQEIMPMVEGFQQSTNKIIMKMEGVNLVCKNYNLTIQNTAF
jgi:hypothetical protein